MESIREFILNHFTSRSLKGRSIAVYVEGSEELYSFDIIEGSVDYFNAANAPSPYRVNDWQLSTDTLTIYVK